MNKIYYEIQPIFASAIFISVTHYLLNTAASAALLPDDEFTEFFGVLETKFKAVFALKMLSNDTRQLACTHLMYEVIFDGQLSIAGLIQANDDILLQSVYFKQATIREESFSDFFITEVPVFTCRFNGRFGPATFYATYTEQQIYYKLRVDGLKLEAVYKTVIPIFDHIRAPQIMRLLHNYFSEHYYRLTAEIKLVALIQNRNWLSVCHKFGWKTEESIPQIVVYKNVEILNVVYKNIPMLPCPKKNAPGEFIYVLHYMDSIYFAVVHGPEENSSHDIFHYSIKQFNF